MAITTDDGLKAALAASPSTGFYKPSITSVAGFWYSLWRTAGTPAAGGTPTTSGSALTRTSAGALPILAEEAGLTSYLTAFEATCTVAGTLMLCDRIVEYAGFSSVTTGTQAMVATPTLPARATNATDIELWLEAYTAGGATAPGVVTAVYTDQDGVGSHTATMNPALAGTAYPVQRTYRFPLAAGDTGVKSVQSIASTVSTGTAGSIGPVLRRCGPTLRVSVANLGDAKDWAQTHLFKFGPDAALELLWLPTTTSTGNLIGLAEISQG